MYDVEGALIRKIKLLRINDLALTRDGTVMVMVTQEKLIKVQRLSSEGKDVRLSRLPLSSHADHKRDCMPHTCASCIARLPAITSREGKSSPLSGLPVVKPHKHP